MLERLDRVVSQRLHELVPIFCTALCLLDMHRVEAAASSGGLSSEF